MSGLDPDTDYLFEVRAKNGIDFGTAASVTKRRARVWSFTLRDGSASDVTELTEGGDSATARVTITNDSRFSTDQEITLEWGGFSLEDGRIQGAGNTSTITITAGASTGQLDLSAPDNEVNPVYFPLETADLTATWEDTVIGTIMDLRRIDDEEAPVARITDAPLSVNEGDSFDVDIGISVRYPNPEFLKFTITGRRRRPQRDATQSRTTDRGHPDRHRHADRRREHHPERRRTHGDIHARDEHGLPLHPRHRRGKGR